MHDTSESATHTGLFARLTVVAAVAYQLLLIALILVRLEIDPARKPISEYAIGRLGWVARIAQQATQARYREVLVGGDPQATARARGQPGSRFGL